MSKTAATYWNILDSKNTGKWEPIEGTDGMLEQLTLAIDETTGDYTRMTRFKKGADTSPFGGKFHSTRRRFICLKNLDLLSM